MNAVIFIGIQASGKSSFYFKHFSKTHLRINLDMLKTRRKESIIFNACIEAKQSMVIDNTNPSKADRIRYIEKLKENRFKVVGYYFRSSVRESLVRNEKRQGKEKIPEKGILSCHNKLELPDYKEGFDRLYYTSISENGFKIEEWKDEI